MKFQFVHLTQKIEHIANHSFILRNIMYLYYKPIIKKEIRLSNLTSSSNVLFIGGGYMPVSAILLYKQIKANITVIDNDSRAIEQASRLLKKLKLDDHIHLIYQEGIDSDVKEFDVVTLAMQINPLDEVFDSIYTQMKKGSKIIIRKPKKIIVDGYHNIELAIKPTNTIKQSLFRNIGSSELYVKQ